MFYEIRCINTIHTNFPYYPLRPTADDAIFGNPGSFSIFADRVEVKPTLISDLKWSAFFS
jgi:hypothetical protein